MPTACFQYKEWEESLTSDKREQKTGGDSFRGCASSPSQMPSALCFHPTLHFLLPSFCHVHQPSSAVHVKFPQFPRSLGSSRCCLGGKDSRPLLSSCALDQSALTVPNIKCKFPPVNGLSRSQRSGSSRIYPAGKMKFLELHLAQFFVVRLPSDL